MKKFKGRKRGLNPKKLIQQDKSNDLDNLFLSLSLIFNDLKDIILFQDLINKNYQPVSSAIEAHDGEFAGINMHIIRILSSIINEFLILLKENPAIQSAGFTMRLDKLKPEQKQLWEDLIEIAKREPKQSNPTHYALMMIRGNITAHYHNAGKNLRRGFIDRFFKKTKSKQIKNQQAYYSLEDTIEETRFYFADAAAEEYMIGVSNNWPAYMKDINNLVRAIHSALYFIVKDRIVELQ